MARFAVWPSVALSSIGIILIAVCIATDSWVSRRRPAFETNEGLFYRCVKNKHVNGEIHSKCDRIYANFRDFPGISYVKLLSYLLYCCCFPLKGRLCKVKSFYIRKKERIPKIPHSS